MSQIIWWTLITTPKDARIIPSLDHMNTLCRRSKTRLGCPTLFSPYPFSRERERGWGGMPGLHSFLFSFCPKIWLFNLLFIFIIFFLYNSQSISQKFTSSTPKVKTIREKLENDIFSSQQMSCILIHWSFRGFSSFSFVFFPPRDYLKSFYFLSRETDP